MNTICKKILVIGIILLFVGVSISSGMSVDYKPVISQDESEECSGCRELNNAELVMVKQLVNRVEVYSKLLLVLSKDKPEIRDKVEELSNLIHSIDWEFPIICDILENILLSLDNYLFYLGDLQDSYPAQSISWYIIAFWAQFIQSIQFTMGYITYVVFGCYYYHP